MKRTSLTYVSVKLLPIFFIRSFLRLVLPNDGKGGNRWRRNNSRWGKMSGEIFFSFGRISIREGACTARVRGKVVRWWPFRCKNYSCEWLWKLLQLERNAEKSFLVKFDRKKVEKKNGKRFWNSFRFDASKNSWVHVGFVVVPRNAKFQRKKLYWNGIN